jgi:biotin transport system substrate-specific component
MFIETLHSSIQQRTQSRALTETLIFASGVAFIVALTRLVIHLPWTPVPITGQTFGVALMALLFGRNRAFSVVAGYLAIGASGLPVFAGGAAGLSVGPTLGYLVGMLVAAPLVGALADRGATNSFFKAFAAAICGSLVIFTCGLTVLSHFLPQASLTTLFAVGLWPFLAGDFVKNILAATIAARMTRI